MWYLKYIYALDMLALVLSRHLDQLQLQLEFPNNHVILTEINRNARRVKTQADIPCNLDISNWIRILKVHFQRNNEMLEMIDQIRIIRNDIHHMTTQVYCRNNNIVGNNYRIQNYEGAIFININAFIGSLFISLNIEAREDNAVCNCEGLRFPGDCCSPNFSFDNLTKLSSQLECISTILRDFRLEMDQVGDHFEENLVVNNQLPIDLANYEYRLTYSINNHLHFAFSKDFEAYSTVSFGTDQDQYFSGQCFNEISLENFVNINENKNAWGQIYFLRKGYAKRYNPQLFPEGTLWWNAIFIRINVPRNDGGFNTRYIPVSKVERRKKSSDLRWQVFNYPFVSPE